MNNKYTVSVLFVNYEDFWSKVVYYVLGCGYSHAAISVDEEDEIYYSFNFKGFRREKPRKHVVSKSVCYKLSVSREEYNKIAEMIDEFQRRRFEWRFNLCGLLLSRIHIKRRKDMHYFCSEFVAEMLERAQVYTFKKSVAHYIPNRLEREIQQFRNIEQIILNPIQRCYY